MDPLYFNGFVAGSGLLLHYFIKWDEYRQTTEKVNLAQFFAKRPAKSAISMMATVCAFAVTYSMDWMNPGMAFGCGYMGNSVADNLAKRFLEHK